MNFTGTSKRKPTVINITSLIDVMFLLVIFVLLAAKFEPDGGIAVDLPTAVSEEKPKKRETFTLTITHDGTYYIQKELVTKENLAKAIRTIRAGGENPVMIINADRTADTQHLIHATEVAKQVGQSSINFKTKP